MMAAVTVLKYLYNAQPTAISPAAFPPVHLPAPFWMATVRNPKSPQPVRRAVCVNLDTY
ncbi:hypothetical protein LEMLEM_LOCUS20768 [Lemmus lemmus]